MARLLENKKIAMIVAFRDFRDEELFIPRSIFFSQGAEVKIASSQKGQAVGAYGGVVEIDLELAKIRVSDFDAIIFVGGTGAAEYFEDKRCHTIAREAFSAGKVLGAICIAPAILARSGVLKGRKATVWTSPLDKSMVKILKEEGVLYEEKAVVVDGKIVTANGPLVSRKFGEEIVKLLV